MAIPNAPDEVVRSGGSVVNTVRQTGGTGWLDTGINKVTHGALELAHQALIVLPWRLFVKPAAGGLNSAVRGTVRNVADFTGDMLAAVPWIPVPGTGSSRVENGPLASNHEHAAPPLPGTGDLRVGPGSNPRSPNA